MIDAVVATRDSRELVVECVDRLRSPLLERVIVVDNGSQDGTADAVREACPEAVVVRLEDPEGLSHAYNRGAEAGSAELVLFLNDDVFATDESISELARALGLRPDAVAAAGRLVDPQDGRTQAAYLPRAFPGSLELAGSLLGRPRRPLRLSGDEAVVVDQPPGACLLVRRGVFEKVGRWDEDFEFWFEDVDLARRLEPAGGVLYVPTAVFPHVGGASAGRLSHAEVVSRSYRGALLYAQKHLGGRGRAITAPAYALGSAVRVLTTRDPASRRAYARALRDSVRLAAGRPLRPARWASAIQLRFSAVSEEELRQAVAEIKWWHTIDLGHGIVTPGKDNSPEKLRFLRIPERLDGRSVLDIGAWDGFFSFEAERRGAARVLATDSFAWEGTNVGSKRGFELARRALDSKVEDRHIDPTELSPDAIGTFDVVLFLGVLYHLRDPLGVLERVASVTAPGGLCIVETFVDLLHVRQPAAAFYPFAELNDDPTNWFGFNPAGAEAALRAVGFSRVERVGVDRDAGGSVPRLLAAAGMAGARLKRRDRPVLAPFERGRLVLHAYKP